LIDVDDDRTGDQVHFGEWVAAVETDLAGALQQPDC
jgi:hypothetical protein